MGKFTVRKLAHAIAGGVAACMIFAAVPASMAQAEETEQDKLTITLTRTDTLGDTVYVGDILRYTVNYTNNSNEPLTVFPAESNLDGVLTSGTPNCRWSNLGAGKSAQCTTATHVLTKQDVDAGGFEPRTVWKATHDRAGNDVVQEGIQANASRISISEGSRPVEPDEATIPTERAEGEGLVIAYPGQYGVACYRIQPSQKRQMAGFSLLGIHVLVAVVTHRNLIALCNVFPKMEESRLKRAQSQPQACKAHKNTVTQTLPM